MAVALGILKWVGIILGGLIGLLLVLLLLVLFVPVRYRIDGKLKETELTEGAAERIKESAKLEAGFSWLLHLLRGSFRYPDETSFTVKLLMFTIVGGEKKEEEEEKKPETRKPEKEEKREETDKKREEKEKAEKEKAEKEKAEKEKAEKEKAEKEKVEKEKAEREKAEREKKEKEKEKEKKDIVISERKATPDRTVRETTKASAAEAPEEEEKPSFFARILGGIKNLLLKPYEVAQKIFYTISSVCGKISMVRDLLESDTFARAKEAALKHTGRILRGVLPKKSDVRILYGTGDPYIDAEILAAYSILSPQLSAFLQPEADFERRVAGADVHIRGRITGATLLWNAAMLYFNKDIKRVRKRIEKIRGEKDESESESV
ncbi:MAG: hypothetical protein IJR00_09095 [Lachnospiraceae bacterium]|nr:hypothetical protein [Lachnospiraceae bacterium]